MAEQRKKLRLGELLVQQGLITKDQLAIVLAEQRNSNIPLGRLMVRLGFVTETAIRDIMARTVGQESIDLAQVVADSEALSLVPEEFARRNHLLPIAYDPADHVLTVATTEIFNVVALDQLRAMLGPQMELKTQLAAEAQLSDYIDQFYGHELSVDGILREIETGEIDFQIGDAKCLWFQRIAAAQKRIGARQELGIGKWFRQTIIGAQFQTFNAIGNTVRVRENQYRCGLRSA